MRRFICFFAALMLLQSSCFAFTDEDYWVVEDEEDQVINPIDQARGIMRGMTVEEKIYQLFIVCPEDLTGEDRTTAWPKENPLLSYPVGGVVIFGQNIVSEDQIRSLAENLYLDAIQADVFTPFLAVDEEGGAVSRVANKLGYPFAMSPGKMGKLKQPQLAREAGTQIAGYLKPLGFNLDFAPVSDVLVADAPEIGDRAYGKDASLVTEYSLAMAQGLRDGGIIPCFKHFPGHGAVTGNTHNGKALSRRTAEQMASAEWIPYAAGIEEGIEMIMISHLTAQELDKTAPSSLSKNVIQHLLRDRMGYNGVVVTDALRMEAIVENYDSDEAAVQAIQAGADLLLLPNNFKKAVEGIRKAVAQGDISMARLDESVERILALKIQYGLIQ